MTTIEDITFEELQNLLKSLRLPADTRMTVRFDDVDEANKVLYPVNAVEAMKKFNGIGDSERLLKADKQASKAVRAMKKLKGSGNGRLVTALLAERERDVWQ